MSNIQNLSGGAKTPTPLQTSLVDIATKVAERFGIQLPASAVDALKQAASPLEQLLGQGGVVGADRRPGAWYTATAGDTLSDVADRAGQSLETLLADNPQFAGNPDMIQPGDRIALRHSFAFAAEQRGGGTTAATAGTVATTAAPASANATPAASTAPATPVAATAPLGPITLNVGNLDNPRADGGFLLSIAAAEGNVDAHGNLARLDLSNVPDGYPAHGHTDPGNGAFNKGRLSYQDGANGSRNLTMAQAESRAVDLIKPEIATFEAKVQAMGLKPSDANYRFVIASLADLRNQTGSAAFVGTHSIYNELPAAIATIKAGGNAEKAIADARVRAFQDDSGVFQFNPGGQSGCIADQARRVHAIHTTLSNFGGLSTTAGTDVGTAPARLLTKGASGGDVAELQRLLIGNGAKIGVSGTFDNATEREVLAFKSRAEITTPSNLPASAVGATTLQALRAGAQAAAATGAVAPGAGGQVQVRLPVIAQITPVDCGITSVVMAVNGLTGRTVTSGGLQGEYGFSLLSAISGNGLRYTDHGNLHDGSLGSQAAAWNTFQSALAKGHPVLFGANNEGNGTHFSGGAGHYMICTGTFQKNGENWITFNDPNGGVQRQCAFADLWAAGLRHDGNAVIEIYK